MVYALLDLEPASFFFGYWRPDAVKVEALLADFRCERLALR
jgi:hypothetical protein